MPDTNPQYRASVVWSDEDVAYVATCPEFPGLSGVDPDPERALSDLHEAIAMAIEVLHDEGRPIPKPSG